MQPGAAPPNTGVKVAVIGAGASGLVAARELQRESHRVVVFERNNRIGGTWVYTPTTESDPLSLDPSRTIVHTSLYNSLRTNLPRESMGFGDYPFFAKEDGDPRRFPSHREVLRYLDDFTSEFGLKELIRFETQVDYVGLNEDRRWEVRSRNENGDVDVEAYDAVVVCNGHYTTPHLAEISGIDVWPGKQIHSHNYRVPDPFSEKVVVLVGNSHSGFDISRDIARVAQEVHVASKSFVNAAPTEQHASDNLWFHSMIEMAREDGTVVFQDGTSVFADVILHCTGYKFDFPFLKTDGIVTVDDNRVGPLYQHIFPPQLAPWLSFIGLPWKVCPFPLYELQSKWVAGILSGKLSLPSQKNMISDVKAFYSKLDAAGVPKRYTHSIMGCQFEYNDWLADQCGLTPEKWRNEMWKATALNRSVRPETYRDKWEDEDLILQAHEEFIQYTRRRKSRRGPVRRRSPRKEPASKSSRIGVELEDFYLPPLLSNNIWYALLA